MQGPHRVAAGQSNRLWAGMLSPCWGSTQLHPQYLLVASWYEQGFVACRREPKCAAHTNKVQLSTTAKMQVGRPTNGTRVNTVSSLTCARAHWSQKFAIMQVLQGIEPWCPWCRALTQA